MKILGQRVIAKRYQEEIEKKTSGGVIIPETVDRSQEDNVFQVVAVGTQVEEPDLVEGSFILVGNRASKGADTVPLEGEELLIFGENQILGVDNGENSND